MGPFVIFTGVLMIIVGIAGLNLKDKDYNMDEKHQIKRDKWNALGLVLFGIFLVICGIFVKIPTSGF